MDESGAIWIPNGNAFAGRNGHTPRYVIIHGTAGGTSAVAIANYFKSTEGSDDPKSTHYVIGTDGTICQCNAEADGAWGNGVLSAGRDPWWSADLNPNLITISIEHCKPSQDNSDPLTEAQKAASFQLIKHICERHGIPKRKADAFGGIAAHASIDPVNRRHCPGDYPWDELFAYLNAEASMNNTDQLKAADGSMTNSRRYGPRPTASWCNTDLPKRSARPGIRKIILLRMSSTVTSSSSVIQHLEAGRANGSV
jgi:N-acetyl-anhydromuramyl-L-alanine amidase AmpD